MPVTIDEIQSRVNLLDRGVAPGEDVDELGVKLAELEQRLETLESALAVSETEVVLTAKRIAIRADEEVFIEGAVSSVTLNPAGMTVKASGQIRLQSAQLSVDTSTANFNSTMVTFAGVIKSETCITNTVIAATYTPGAGNIF